MGRQEDKASQKRKSSASSDFARHRNVFIASEPHFSYPINVIIDDKWQIVDHSIKT